MKTPNQLKQQNEVSIIHLLENAIEVAIEDGENSIEAPSYCIFTPYILKELNNSGYIITQSTEEKKLSGDQISLDKDCIPKLLREKRSSIISWELT